MSIHRGREAVSDGGTAASVDRAAYTNDVSGWSECAPSSVHTAMRTSNLRRVSVLSGASKPIMNASYTRPVALAKIQVATGVCEV